MSSISDSDFEQVIQRIHGEDHFLVSATEDEKMYTKHFPTGTRSWIIEHESRTCTHTPPCHWFGRVYWYQGRFTLVKDMEMPFISMRELIDRVTGALEN